jgi:ferredoxin
MTTQWGIFLCNCQHTLALDPQRFDLPTPHVQFATHSDGGLQAFADLVSRERCTHAMIACCDSPTRFEDALRPAIGPGPKIEFVDLKASCFAVHADPREAHDKAGRLLRGALQAAEMQAEPRYLPLRSEGRVLIVADEPLAGDLARRLSSACQPILVLSPEAPAVVALPSWRVYRGELLEVSGRLGDFHALVELSGGEQQELVVDQVAVLAAAPPARPTRTGYHVLSGADAADLDQLAARIDDLTGDFLKTVHVAYDADICAGGAAGQQACGACIPACPYEAIRRDPTNRLRIEVDHSACEGCGACSSACPTSALRYTEPSPQALYAQLAALLAPDNGDVDPIVVFSCSEQGKRLIEEAGRRPLPYPAKVLGVQVPCLRYVSATAILGALRLGAAGVGLLGCAACPHGERALLERTLAFCCLTLEAFDLGPERLRLFVTAGGNEAETIDDLTRFADSLAPAPIHRDGLAPWRVTGNRQGLTEIVGAFMEQRQREPGRQPLASKLGGAALPFAMAEVEAEGCTLCRSCVNVCPTHAFRLDEPTSSLQFNHFACVACGLCETVCPERVISLRHEVVFTREALDYRTVVRDEMVACLKCGTPFVNRKSLDAILAKVLQIGPLMDAFSGERRNLLRMCPDCRAVAAMQEVEQGWEP